MRSVSVNKKIVQRYNFNLNMTNGIFIICILWMSVFVEHDECLSLKRSASPESNSENIESSLDKMNLNYDEYPVSSYHFF